MLNRLCFVLCALWALLAFANFATRAQPKPPLGALEYSFALLPLCLWLGGRLLYRYLRYGPAGPHSGR